MQAYFDEKLKVWVFPGEDPAEKAAPLKPPPKTPKTPSEAAPAPEEPEKNDDPVAAMMALPNRNPRAARSKPGVRPSPRSVPPMFMPGLMSPTPNGSAGGTSAAPKVAVFQPKPNGEDGKKENEEPEDPE